MACRGRNGRAEPALKIYRLAGGRITAVADVDRTAAAEWLLAE